MIINILYKQKNSLLYVLLLFIIFSLNMSYKYYKYTQFKDEEFLSSSFKVINIYDKTYKLKNEDFTFYTKFDLEDESFEKNDYVELTLITKYVSFYDYLKGFYAKSFFSLKEDRFSFKDEMIKDISSSHEHSLVKQLFEALFLAIPISSELRDICNNWGINHLIALSGFHLAILSVFIYYVFYYPYYFVQDKYFPYRNRRFDLVVLSSFILFLYLYLTDFLPSLLRAYIMFIFALLFLRYKIKIFSFFNLFLVFLTILAFFPKYIFSFALWFSLAGVFYILLYVQYFQNFKSKLFHILFFNMWIYLIMTPIIHMFFPVFTFYQLLSPFVSILFPMFYISELVLHIFDYGSFLDEYILMFLNTKIEVYTLKVNTYFFIAFICCSFLAIKSKFAFYVLNFFLFLFFVYAFILFI